MVKYSSVFIFQWECVFIKFYGHIKIQEVSEISIFVTILNLNFGIVQFLMLHFSNLVPILVKIRICVSIEKFF